MLKIEKRYAWLGGILCAAGLIVGCGDSAPDQDGDGVNETIEQVSPSPAGVPSTDMGEVPGPTNPTRDVDPDKPGLAPAVPVDAPPYKPGEMKADPNAPGGASEVKPE